MRALVTLLGLGRLRLRSARRPGAALGTTHEPRASGSARCGRSTRSAAPWSAPRTSSSWSGSSAGCSAWGWRRASTARARLGRPADHRRAAAAADGRGRPAPRAARHDRPAAALRRARAAGRRPGRPAGRRDTRALAQSAIASTARITSSGCGSRLAVGSGFFVSPTHAVTNAHVVAGSTTHHGHGSAAPTSTPSVVAFDPAADLALLYVAGAEATPLALSPHAPARGTPAAVLGYPGGGDLTVTAAAVTATHDSPRPGHLRRGQLPRNVVEMRSGDPPRQHRRAARSSRPASSAASSSAPRERRRTSATPSAADEAVERLGPFIGSTAAVDTGACL